jgi:hypothetical protein
MRTTPLVILHFLFAVNFLSAQNNSKEYFSNNNTRNSRVDGTIGIELNTSEPADFKQELLLQKNKAMEQNMKSIVTRYKKTLENNELGYTILKGNNLLIKSALMCYSKSIRIPILCEVADAGLEKVESMVKERMDKDLTALLKTNLDRVLRQSGKDTYNEILQTKDPKEFVLLLDTHTKMMDKLYESMTDVQEHDRDIVLAAMIRASDNAIKNNFVKVNQTIAINNEELKKINTNVSALSRSFYRFALENDKKLTKMANLQATCVALGVSNLQVSQSTEKKVNFLQNFAFSRMTPEEQLATLNSGIQDENISPEKKEILQKQLEAEIKRKELNNTIAGYLSGASELVGIADKLGLDKKIVNDLQTGVNIGNAAFNAFTSMQSGNVLGAISAVSSIFGMGGRDIARERHEEIMQQFENVFFELDEIKKGINDLKAGQQAIIANQQKTFDALITINKQIDENQKEILSEIDKLNDHITYNRQLILDWVKNGWQKCSEMVYQGAGRYRKQIIDTQNNIIPSIAELSRLCKTEWNGNDNINTCFDLVSKICDDEGVFSISLFDIRNSQTDKDTTKKIDYYLNNVYKPAEAIVRDFDLNDLLLTQRFSSLFTPMTNVRSLSQKLESMRINKTDISGLYTEKAFLPNFNVYLWFEAIEKYTNYALNIYYYRTVIDRHNNKPYDTTELIRTLPLTGYNDLQKSINLVDFGIAQQNLLAGDILLPIIYKKMTEKDTINCKENNKYIKLLNANRILTANFVTYALTQDFKHKPGILSYDASLKSNEVDMLEINFMHHWDFKYSIKDTLMTLGDQPIQIPKNWSVLIGDYCYPLPSSTNLQSGEFLYNIELQKLLTLKQRLIEELQTFEVYNTLSNEERSSYIFLNFDGLYNNSPKNYIPDK